MFWSTSGGWFSQSSSLPMIRSGCFVRYDRVGFPGNFRSVRLGSSSMSPVGSTMSIRSDHLPQLVLPPYRCLQGSGQVDVVGSLLLPIVGYVPGFQYVANLQVGFGAVVERAGVGGGVMLIHRAVATLFQHLAMLFLRVEFVHRHRFSVGLDAVKVRTIRCSAIDASLVLERFSRYTVLIASSSSFLMTSRPSQYGLHGDSCLEYSGKPETVGFEPCHFHRGRR